MVNVQLEMNETVKDEFLGLRQFLATKSYLKMMKNAFYFSYFSFLIYYVL